MGAGAGEDTGGFAVILPEEPEPEPRSPLGEDLEAIAERIRAVAALMERAAAGGTDVEQIHLARVAVELSMAIEEQGRREIAVAAIWAEGFAAGAEQCLVRKQGTGQHRKARPDYLKPLAVAAGGALRAVSRHPGSHGTAHPVAAAVKAQLTGAKTAAALSVTGAAAVAVVAAGSMQQQPYVTHLYPPAATASPAGVSSPTWYPPEPAPAPSVSSASPMPPFAWLPPPGGPSPSPSPTGTGTSDPATGTPATDTQAPAAGGSDSGAAGCPAATGTPATDAPVPAVTGSTSAVYTGRHRNPVAAAV